MENTHLFMVYPLLGLQGLPSNFLQVQMGA